MAAAPQAFEATYGSMWPTKRSDPTQSTRGWEFYHLGKGGAPNATRTFTCHVNHAKKMSAIPCVFMGLNAIDLLVCGPLCIHASPANITNTGMDIQFVTRNDSCVWSAGTTWFAYVPHPGGPEFRTGVVNCDPGMPGYSLHMPGQPGMPHVYEYFVPFPQPFDRSLPPPMVLCVIQGFTAPHRNEQGAIPLRLRVFPTEIDHDRFKINVMTWEDSMVSDVTVSWLAYSVDPASPYARCISSQTLPCMNSAPNFAVYQGNGPRDFVQPIAYSRDPFPDVPAVATWLSGFEVFTRADVRLKAIEKSRTTVGCDLVFGTWANTSVGGGDITWLAFIDDVAPVAAGAFSAPPSGMRDSTGRRFAMAPAGAPAAAPAPASGAIEPGMECIVCFERAKDTLLQPCNHICCCSECASRLKPNICPVCRTAITSKSKIFFT